MYKYFSQVVKSYGWCRGPEFVPLHSIDSLYSTNSVNIYVPSDNQQFRYKIARGR